MLSVNVESCTKSRLVVSTYGATDGGIIYIQGQGENCKQPTQSGMAIYEFDFSQCGIEWVSYSIYHDLSPCVGR